MENQTLSQLQVLCFTGPGGPSAKIKIMSIVCQQCALNFWHCGKDQTHLCRHTLRVLPVRVALKLIEYVYYWWSTGTTWTLQNVFFNGGVLDPTIQWSCQMVSQQHSWHCERCITYTKHSTDTCILSSGHRSVVDILIHVLHHYPQENEPIIVRVTKTWYERLPRNRERVFSQTRSQLVITTLTPRLRFSVRVSWAIRSWILPIFRGGKLGLVVITWDFTRRLLTLDNSMFPACLS